MSPQRQFAVDVVRQLREAGHVAYWAGGCVRDGLLERLPKDYDVATSATPDEIRNVFGHRRTLAIGAAFGVITVLGKKEQGQIEVATFRQDAAYSDGRHPDSVRFSTPEHDAQRRDFTINGLFYDPLEERVIDFVGGQEDLQAGILRAIGDADARIDEDKLRMLRAVRFAATYELTIEPGTLAAVQRHADELRIVSAERIAEEMRRMLRHAQRRRAVELLRESRLLPVVLPEVEFAASNNDVWERMLEILDALAVSGSFESALAVLLSTAQIDGTENGVKVASEVATRWRLSNDERNRTTLLLKHENLIRRAADAPWPQVQRVLILPGAEELVDYCEAIANALGNDLSSIEFCREKLALPREQLDPPPLITGDDLKKAGIPPGKHYQELLNALRDAQLEGKVTSSEKALEVARKQWESR